MRWLGYEDSYDTWEPWSGLRVTDALHKYLIDNNLKQLVPTQFHENYPATFTSIIDEEVGEASGVVQGWAQGTTRQFLSSINWAPPKIVWSKKKVDNIVRNSW